MPSVSELYTLRMRPPIHPDDYRDHLEKARQRSLNSKPGRMWTRASLVFVSGTWNIRAGWFCCGDGCGLERGQIVGSRWRFGERRGGSHWSSLEVIFR